MTYNYNYGNPYQNYQSYPNYQNQYSNVIPSQNINQFQMQNGIMGKVVDNFDMITANDVPMSGEPATFIKRDLSEVQVRMWSPNGQISTTSYKPFLEPKDTEVTNVSTDEIKSLYGSLDAFKSDVMARLDRLDELLTKNGTKRGAKQDE